jgi:hypothetical protein
MQEIGIKKTLLEQNNSLQVHVEQGKLSLVSPQTPSISKFFVPVSYHDPSSLVFPQGFSILT